MAQSLPLLPEIRKVVCWAACRASCNSLSPVSAPRPTQSVPALLNCSVNTHKEAISTSAKNLPALLKLSLSLSLSLSHTHTHAHTHTHSHKHTHMQTHTHSHKHTHTRTPTHAHTHMHSQSNTVKINETTLGSFTVLPVTLRPYQPHHQTEISNTSCKQLTQWKYTDSTMNTHPAKIPFFFFNTAT